MNLFFLNLLSDACNDVGVLRVILFLKTLLQYVFTLVPVAAVLWLTIDMTKNVFSQDADTQRKNLGMFVRRCIYLIIVFLIPTIVNLTLSLFAEDIDTSEYSKCMNVTSESIKVLLKKNKDECNLDNYEWDEINGHCVFVGESSVLPEDFTVIDVNPKADVTESPGGIRRLNRSFPNSKSSTMMEYTQGDERWAYDGFCDDNVTNMASSGCGAAAFAMIVTGYGNDPNATPKTIRDYVCNNGLHRNYGLGTDPIHSEKLVGHFGMKAEVLWERVYSKNYSQERANLIKEAVDQGYGVIIDIPNHWVAVDKGGCPADKVYYYNPNEKWENGCVTMEKLWDMTWDRRERCTNPKPPLYNPNNLEQYCGWKYAYKYWPADDTY